MTKTFLSLAFFAISSTSFASQLPGAPIPAPVLSQYEHCLQLEESGIIPFVPCHVLKAIEDARVESEASSEYEACLALEEKGIIPYVPCYVIKEIEDAAKND